MHEARTLDKLAKLALDARYLPKTGGILPPSSAFAVPPSAKTKKLQIPFNFDSEFQDNLGKTTPFDDEILESRDGVTVQIRGVQEESCLILAHPNQAAFAVQTGQKLRHPVVTQPCVVGDWLESRGVDVHIVNDEDLWKRTKKTCKFQMISHFAVADVAFLAGTPEFAETIQELFARKKLQQTRRLQARASGHKNAFCGSVGLKPWVVFLEGIPFRMKLEITDTNALHGVAGYKALAANVGFKLDAKERVSRTGRNAEITRMNQVYFDRPEDFDAYAAGDTYGSDIIEKDEALRRHIWHSLGIEQFFTGSKLTIGAAVAGIVKARIAKLLGFEDVEDESLGGLTTGTHNAAFLSRFAKEKNPIALLSKVDGGRCRTANPLLTGMNGVLCDIDISGAYASAMSAVPLIFGKTRCHGFGNARDGKPDLQDCISVKEMKRRYSLVPRHWFARIQTKEPYTFETDVIPSWVDWRHLAERKTDSEVAGLEILQDPSSGEMRCFSKEIWAGTLTSDLLQTIEATFSPKQLAEWYEKTVVRSLIYVDTKDRITLEDFAEHAKNGTMPEFGWCSATLGELVSDQARGLRIEEKKANGKSALETLYKLISNTVYGVSVSRHFESSSVIAGSNVTACVRAFMYLCEKGLNLVGSITDGQIFDLNRVLHRKRNYNVTDLALGTRAYRVSKRDFDRNGEAKFEPLLGIKITAEWNGKTTVLTVFHENGTSEVLAGKDAEKRINEAAFEHLLKLWPKCPLLTEETVVVAGLHPDGTVKYEKQKGLFRFEMKTFVKAASFHGSANYQHVSFDPSKSPEIKMRSFEGKREHTAYTIDENGLAELKTYEDPRTDEELERFPYANPHLPAARLLGSIQENPHAVPFLPPFVKSRILLPGVFQSQRKFQSSSCQIGPGDSIYVLGKPRLVSLTAFTFQTRKQYESWKKAHTRLINRHGVSFELWFMNLDGTVDYARMLKTLDDAICSGVLNPISHLDANQGKRGSSDTVTRFHEAKQAMKTHLGKRVSSLDEDDLPIVYDDGNAGFNGGEWQ